MWGWIILGLIGAGALWFAGKVSSRRGLLPSAKRVLFAVSIIGAFYSYITAAFCAAHCENTYQLPLFLVIFALLLLLWMLENWRVNWWKVLLIIPALFLLHIAASAMLNPDLTFRWIKHGFSMQKVQEEFDTEQRQQEIRDEAEFHKTFNIPEKISVGTRHVVIPPGDTFIPRDWLISQVGLFDSYDSDFPPEETERFDYGDKIVFVKTSKRIIGGRILVYDIPSQRIILEERSDVVDCMSDAWLTNNILSIVCEFNIPDDYWRSYKPRYGEILNINLTTGNFEIDSFESARVSD